MHPITLQLVLKHAMHWGECDPWLRLLWTWLFGAPVSHHITRVCWVVHPHYAFSWRMLMGRMAAPPVGMALQL